MVLDDIDDGGVGIWVLKISNGVKTMCFQVFPNVELEFGDVISFFEFWLQSFDPICIAFATICRIDWSIIHGGYVSPNC